MRQFCRTEMLIGADAQQKLNDSSVAVFGLGGVGSFTVEALARAGVGHLTLVDFDTVDPTNINRQLFALHSTVGKYKTEVAKSRILDINPNAQVTTLCCRFDQTTASAVDFSRFNYVVDAIDTVSSKLLLAKICFEQNVPIISCMGTGNKFDAGAFRVADVFETKMCPLAKVMRKELKARGVSRLKVVYSEECPQTPLAEYSDTANADNTSADNAASIDTNTNAETIGTADIGTDTTARTDNEKNTAYNSSVHRKATPASISYVPPVAGMLLAGEVIKDIIGHTTK